MDRSENAAVTQRPPAYAELLVDSLDRYPLGIPAFGAQTTSSDWRTILQQVVLNGYFTRLAVSQIQFQWNLPTIITGYNDTIRIAVDDGANPPVESNLVIPQGFYTPDALAAAIQVALIAIDGAAGFTCVFDGTVGALKIETATAGYTFGVVDVPGLVQARALSTTGLYSAPDLLAPLLLGAPPSMLATRFVDICSSTLTKFQRVKDTTTLKNPTISNVIARVYPTPPNTLFQTIPNWVTAVTELPGNSIGSHPFTLCIDYNTPKFIKWSPDEALSNFDLQLRDDFGELLPYNPGGGPACEYQLTILASES
jgi:hypothetical protein